MCGMNDCRVAYLYFDYKKQLEQTPVKVISCLLRQILSQYTSAPRAEWSSSTNFEDVWISCNGLSLSMSSSTCVLIGRPVSISLSLTRLTNVARVRTEDRSWSLLEQSEKQKCDYLQPVDRFLTTSWTVSSRQLWSRSELVRRISPIILQLGLDKQPAYARSWRKN